MGCKVTRWNRMSQEKLEDKHGAAREENAGLQTPSDRNGTVSARARNRHDRNAQSGWLPGTAAQRPGYFRYGERQIYQREGYGTEFLPRTATPPGGNYLPN